MSQNVHNSKYQIKVAIPQKPVSELPVSRESYVPLYQKLAQERENRRALNGFMKTQDGGFTYGREFQRTSNR